MKQANQGSLRLKAKGVSFVTCDVIASALIEKENEEKQRKKNS